MLTMICYDIFDPRSQADFERGVDACGDDNHNLAYAPWFVDSDQSPTKILENLDYELNRNSDNLLVLNLGTETSCAILNPKDTDKEWLKEHQVDFLGKNRSGVLGIAYTLHGARLEDYHELEHAIAESFPDHYKPVKALYFVAARQSARAVRDKVKRFLPNREPQHPDELLVLEIPVGTKGKAQLRSGNVDWFKEHSIKIVH